MPGLHPTNRIRMIDNPVVRMILDLVPHADPKINRFVLQQWFENANGDGEWRPTHNTIQAREKKTTE